MKSAIQILADAREILSNPDCIVRFTAACDVSGRNVSPLDERAARWCSTGAIVKAAGTTAGEPVAIAMVALAHAMGGDIPRFHDNSLRYQILEKFGEAIALLRGDCGQDVDFAAAVLEGGARLAVRGLEIA